MASSVSTRLLTTQQFEESLTAELYEKFAAVCRQVHNSNLEIFVELCDGFAPILLGIVYMLLDLQFLLDPYSVAQLPLSYLNGWNLENEREIATRKIMIENLWSFCAQHLCLLQVGLENLLENIPFETEWTYHDHTVYIRVYRPRNEEILQLVQTRNPHRRYKVTMMIEQQHVNHRRLFPWPGMTLYLDPFQLTDFREDIEDTLEYFAERARNPNFENEPR